MSINKNLKQERYKLLRQVEHTLEMPMVFLGFVWLALLVVELIWGLGPALELAGTAIWIIFIFDFLLKLIIAPDKKNFFTRNWLTIISLIIPALRIFRALRVVRLLRGLRGIRLVKIVGSLNRSMRSLSATMQRRGFTYVFLLSMVVLFAGAAGMFAFENRPEGLQNYGQALWWTAMMLITSGSEYWPISAEGRALGFLLALYGFSIFGYITATLASFFVGRDAEEQDAPIAGAAEIERLKGEVQQLRTAIETLTITLNKQPAQDGNNSTKQ